MEDQERRLRAKLQLQKGVDSDEEEESSKDEEVAAGKWGKSKRAYYESGEVRLPFALALK